MTLNAYISLFGLALTGPIGKTLIKKSIEYDNKIQQRVLNRIGLFFMTILLPISSIASYAFADNAIVAPIAASGGLFNILFARIFLKEGQNMNRYTVLGIIAFSTGLFLLVFTYTSFVGNEVNDENIEWGVLSLILGIWMFFLTLVSNVCNLFNNNARIQLIGLSVGTGMLMGSDIIASMDKWIYNHDREDWNEINKAIIASCFYTVSCILGMFILNKLLLDPENTMHVVSSIVLSVSLVMDVIADCFVFQRYKLWDANNYAMAIIGLILMIIGINILQTSKSETQKKEKEEEEEKIKLLGETIGIDTKNMIIKSKLIRPSTIGLYARNASLYFVK